MSKKIHLNPEQAAIVSRYQHVPRVRRLYKDLAGHFTREDHHAIGIAHKLFTDMSLLAPLKEVADWVSTKLEVPTTDRELSSCKERVRAAALPHFLERGYGYAHLIAHTLDHYAREQAEQASPCAKT